jgi:carboxyl-terminal processing protease
MKIKKTAIYLSIIFVAIFAVSTTFSDDFEVTKNLEIFSDIFREVNTNYADEVDPEKMMESGLVAMLKNMDPYTVFIPAEEVAAFQSSISGKYAGVGASVFTFKDTILISEIYENSPAMKAGLKAGDKIYAIEGKKLGDYSDKDRSLLLRGLVGTKLSVELYRPGKGKVNLSITREEILVNNVPFFDVVSNDIGYVVLSTFTENAGKNVQQALSELNRRTKLKGVILDLRGNSGGLLSEAVNVVNIFVPKATVVVTTKNKNKENQNSYQTLNNPMDKTIPLVVLVDENSASASEIVAGAIQDLDRGVIIGRKTYGKGLVQNTRDLPYNSKIKITTARYYTPSGRCIQSTNYQAGKAVAIADSLFEKFKTLNGRTVLDGGGIIPDINNTNTELKTILRELRDQRHIFNFGVEYLQKNNVSSAESFSLPESTFYDFIRFLESSGFSSSSQFETALTALEKKLETDNLKALLSTELSEMKDMLKKEKLNKLSRYKKEILFEIQKNIADQAFMRKGSILNTLKTDEAIRKGVEMINSNELYRKTLGF